MVLLFDNEVNKLDGLFAKDKDDDDDDDAADDDDDDDDEALEGFDCLVDSSFSVAFDSALDSELFSCLTI